MFGFADPYGILKLLAKPEIKQKSEEEDFLFEQQPPIKRIPRSPMLGRFLMRLYHSLNTLRQLRFPLHLP